MIWNNLKKIPPLCPMCGTELEFNEHRDVWICMDLDCDFCIGIKKFNEITEDVEFLGNCEICGERINPRFRTCKNCF